MFSYYLLFLTVSGASSSSSMAPAAPAAAPPSLPPRTSLQDAPAAPAARMPYAEAVSRLIFMSWNPGAGARKLAQVIDTGGYHVVAVQEAREDMLSNLNPDRWSYSIKFQQFIGARKPAFVESHSGEETAGKIRWHFVTVHFPRKRVERSTLGILSLHLNNVHAKKTKAGPEEVGATIDKAVRFGDSCSVDLICGDLNMARWRKNDQAAWHEGTLNELEIRGFLPVADYVNECCFVAVHEDIAQTLHTKGSSWGERAQTLEPQQREAFWASFLEKVGAKPTSKDVHWPMSLAMRMAKSDRASGLRQRSKAAIDRRNERKRQRGILPTYWGSAYGRSSGWWSWDDAAWRTGR